MNCKPYAPTAFIFGKDPRVQFLQEFEWVGKVVMRKMCPWRLKNSGRQPVASSA